MDGWRMGSYIRCSESTPKMLLQLCYSTSHHTSQKYQTNTTKIITTWTFTEVSLTFQGMFTRRTFQGIT